MARPAGDAVKGLSLRGPKLHIRSMAAKAKKGERLARSAEHRKQPGRGAAKLMQLTAGDFERTVTYRGIKIEPTMAAGKRSSLARAIRDDLRRTKSEQSRGKWG
jgi:hypothetical protein